MDIREGTYVVVNLNSGLALDVAGGQDRSGANVWQWTVNRGDAQIWSLSVDDATWSEGGEGGRVVALRCALTGRTLDVAGGRMANGSNVQQWDDNGSAAQRWDVVEASGTVTVGADTVPAVELRCHKDHGYALDVSAGGKTAGTNVQIYAANHSAAQTWGLIPVPCLSEDGTYSVMSALDRTLALDVSGASTANGARLQTWTYNGTAAQVFVAHVDDSTGTAMLVNANSGKALDSNGAKADGSRVIQWDASEGNDNQRWLLVRSGDVSVNGQKVPTYVIHAKSSSGRVMDVAGGSREPAAAVQCWAANGSPAQRFWLMPNSYQDASVPQPSCVGLSLSRGAYSRDCSASGESVTVYPCWLSSETGFQARYRTVSSGPSGQSDESEWHNLTDGTTSNDGWGDPWSAQVTGGGWEVGSDSGIAIETSAERDCVRVQVQVRAVRSSGRGGASRVRSAAADASIECTWPHSVSVESVALDPARGLVVAVATDSLRAGCVATAEVSAADGTSLCEARSVGGAWRRAEVAMPLSGLRAIPSDGDAVVVRATWATEHATSSVETTATVSYACAGGLDVSVSRDDDSVCSLVRVGGTSPRAWITAGDGVIEVPLADGAATIPTANGVTIFACATTGSGSSYGTATVSGSSGALVWLWGESWGRRAVMTSGRGEPPSHKLELASDATTSSTDGRALPVVHAGPSMTEPLDASGSIPKGSHVRGESAPAFEDLGRAISHGETCVFSSPEGVLRRVAVTGVSMTYASEYVDVAVNQQAVSE